jgi:hypothetical protein
LATGLTECFAPIDPRFAAIRTAVVVVKGRDRRACGAKKAGAIDWQHTFPVRRWWQKMQRTP